MRKKAWLFAILAGLTAVSTACSDSASNKDNDEEVQQVLTYSLKCKSSETCTVDIEKGQRALVVVELNSSDESGNLQPAAAAPVHVATASTVFMMNQGQMELDPTTDNSGAVAVMVTGQTEGAGTIVFSTKEPYITRPLVFNVNVKAPAINVEPKPEVTTHNVKYNIHMNYEGGKTLNAGEAFIVSGKKCSEIATTGMKPEEVKAIDAGTLKATSMLNGSVTDEVFTISTTETNEVVYAAVGRVQANGVYVAYGCTDDVKRNETDNVEVIIDLEDTYIEPVIVKPDDPKPDDPGTDDPGTDDPKPEDPVVIPMTLDYSGKYYLRSEFNALSLLPHAEVAEGSSVMFKDMLVGDWIEFALNFLSNPEKVLPEILTKQVLPLLLDAEWVKSLIGKINPSIAEMLTPELVAALLEQFGVNKYLENLLNQLTGSIEWWDSATSIISIVNDLGTKFTLEGDFVIPTAMPDENGKISGILHEYSTLLYNNGSDKMLSKCLIGDFATDIQTTDGKRICRVNINTLDSTQNASVKGTMTATFKDKNTSVKDVDMMTKADVSKHSMQLAYGKLIYAALMQAVPYFIKPADGTPAPTTLGGVLEYYVGMGFAALWNKDEAHANNQITSTKCTAVGDYFIKLVDEKIASGDSGGIWSILKSFGGPLVAQACTMGVTALDKMIDNQLGKLSTTSEKVTFSSADCPIMFADPNAKNVSLLSNFGSPMDSWSSAVDKRCSWKMSIATTDKQGNAKENVISGKYFAERISK